MTFDDLQMINDDAHAAASTSIGAAPSPAFSSRTPLARPSPPSPAAAPTADPTPTPTPGRAPGMARPGDGAGMAGASEGLGGVVLSRDGEPVALTGPGRPTLAARLMGLTAADLAEHDRLYGPVPWRGPGGALLHDLRDAGLTGHGGAAFPTWRKLATVLETARRGAPVGSGRRTARVVGPPIVIANAAEGEPESAKDTTLLVRAPHLVLDGLALAAEAVGAGEAVVYVKPGPGAQAVRWALSQRQVAGRDRCPTRVHEAPASYLAGEASAVAAAVAGGPARPHAHWLPLAEVGIGGRPTLVDNVETLAHLATIARWGAGWFRTLGTVDDPGTALVTVTGAVRVPGVVEMPYGTTLGELVELAGGASAPVGALRIGGYGGTWLPASARAGTVFSRAGLAAWDAAPGPGILTVLPAHACGLAKTARIVAELAAQSAGQCGPCLTSSPA